MESPVMCVLVLALVSFITAPAYSQSIHASQNPLPVGSNVTLYSDSSVSAGAWMFNNDIIVMLFPGNEILSDQWINRVTFNSTTNYSSLTIRSLQVADSGVYTLQALNSFRVQLVLSVQVPVSNATLRAQVTDLVEFNDTAVLMCTVTSGSSLSYVWLNGSSEVTDNGGSVQLRDRGATLVMVGVTRNDKGPFRCNVSNGVSYEISPLVLLNISYGPSNAKMTVTPMMHVYRTGSNITMSCSVDSSPTAMIQWMFNGVNLNHFTPWLHLESVTESSSGNYQCLYHNPVTSRFTTAHASIHVMAPVTMASVQIAGGQPILNRTFTLTCETAGSVKSIIWMYNWSPLSGDDTRILSMDNATLTFSPVVQTDNGHYQCVAFNPVSSLASENFTLEFFYGPETPNIMGPTLAQTGDSVTLTCNASSNPPSNYTWLFNNTVVANMSEYVTPPLTVNMSGMYACMAHNNVTGGYSVAYTTLIVHDAISLVQVAAPGYPAIEGHLYSLMCHVTGPAEHVYWMKNGELLHGDNRTALLTENKTLTFDPLEKNDTDTYQCMASNALGNMTSPYYNLVVNFGPEEPTIMGKAFAETGDMMSFHCYAESRPASRFSWWFNGSEVANTSRFYTDHVSFNMSGEYTCVAYNDVTGKNSTNSVTLTVIEAIESVAIRNESVPINHENLTLTCEVTGPYDTVHWTKDGIYLNMSAYADEGPMSYYTGNNTLHFTPVMINNDGVYTCVATNQAGRHASPAYLLQVNYGPLSVNISGPTSAAISSSVTLTCSADSRPDCDFYWFFNNKSSLLHAGSNLTIQAVLTNEGNYICKARNPVTNITMYQTKTVTFGHASAITVPSRGSLLMMGVFVLSLTMLRI